MWKSIRVYFGLYSCISLSRFESSSYLRWRRSWNRLRKVRKRTLYLLYTAVYPVIQVECGKYVAKNISTGAGSWSGLYTFGIQLEIQKRGWYTSCMHRYTTCVYKKGNGFQSPKISILGPNSNISLPSLTYFIVFD